MAKMTIKSTAIFGVLEEKFQSRLKQYVSNPAQSSQSFEKKYFHVW
jgi:hypothetical protein